MKYDCAGITIYTNKWGEKPKFNKEVSVNNLKCAKTKGKKISKWFLELEDERGKRYYSFNINIGNDKDIIIPPDGWKIIRKEKA